MISHVASKAIEESLKHGKAILKFISPNDCGLTGGHQCGFYLQKSAWRLFTEHPPVRGENKKATVSILWQNEHTTESTVTWYGAKKQEYRLTRFGKGFPFLHEDVVGDLLVIVPKNHGEFLAFILDLEEDIEELEIALGVEILDKKGAVYDADAEEISEDEDEDEDGCILRNYREFVQTLENFPSTADFSQKTQSILELCIKSFKSKSSDLQLTLLVNSEYDLFRMAERYLCKHQVQRLFESIDDFLKTANSILQRRKSRAGWSFENQFEYILNESEFQFEMRSKIDGVPDVIFPSKDAYDDKRYPVNKLFMVGLKRTCKDRWRQITREAKRIPEKHLLTLQQGISSNQLKEMRSANVTLIVPKSLHNQYPTDWRSSILTVGQFLDKVSQTIG